MPDMKTMIGKRTREFDKNSKSEKWRKLLRKSNSMVKIANKKFSNSFISNISRTQINPKKG